MHWGELRPETRCPGWLLLTGGTGTFGSAYLEANPRSWIRVLSRDEYKQALLRRRFPEVRFLLGDVRDRERVRRACEGCDELIHAAALKRIDACEHDPGECVKTNVLGTWNVVEAALDAGVSQAILLSSDKAVHPVNVYGASKLCAEKIWLGANAYGGGRCRFSVVRYGNVEGSRGSVAELWYTGAQAIELTDPTATRFWLPASDAVELAQRALDERRAGDVYIPKVRSSSVSALLPRGAKPVVTGLRPGEKLHERLLSDEEVSRTYDCSTHYLITRDPPEGAVRVPSDFRYESSE